MGSRLVYSLIRFVAVPKGLANIIMVQDGTSIDFNESAWGPHFGLLTVDTLMRDTYPYTWMIDLDTGDMFLNLIIVEEAQQLAGVYITPVFEYELEEKQVVNTI